MCLIVVVLLVDMVGTECNVTFNQQHRDEHLRGLSIYTLTHSHKHKSEHDFSYDHISNICSQIHCARSAHAHCRAPLTFLLQHTYKHRAIINERLAFRMDRHEFCNRIHSHCAHGTSHAYKLLHEHQQVFEEKKSHWHSHNAILIIIINALA